MPRVELCGLVSHICVLSNAVVRAAALPEAEDPGWMPRLTASFDPALHEKALDVRGGAPGHRDQPLNPDSPPPRSIVPGRPSL